MTVKKVKGGHAVVHCHGSNNGKPIRGGRHKTKAAAEKQHRAIQANKRT
ncbi:MAG: hypothetical protein ACYS5V_12720 [Planctomycetota bacterium]|jgi:hypothetical protein